VQFMAVRPYIGALVAPTNVPANNPEAPQQQLVLDWVYGYRGFDSRANICWNSKRELVYPSAAIVVSYDSAKHKQRHFQGMVSLQPCVSRPQHSFHSCCTLVLRN